MAKLTPSDIKKAINAWVKFNLSKNEFEDFTGLSVENMVHGLSTDTFVHDAVINRLEILQGPHARTMVAAWKARQLPDES